MHKNKFNKLIIHKQTLIKKINVDKISPVNKKFSILSGL